MVTSFFMLQTLGRWAARVVHARYARNVKLMTLAVAGASGPHTADGDWVRSPGAKRWFPKLRL
jgi:hypothetical protein